MRTSKNKSNKLKGRWLSPSAVIEALGCARSTFYEWAKLPGAPEPNAEKLHNLEAWREFIGNQGLGRPTDPKIEQLKLQRLAVEIEAARFALERRKQLYHLASDVEADWIARMSRAKEILVAKFEGEMPSLYVGKSAPDIMKMNRLAIFDALVEMSRMGAE
jgi:hypothetical protein